jgi:4-hydroxybenzoate polyprenyltransferase
MRINSIFRDWASMARLPNVPTVWSNVFTAWVLAGWGWPGGIVDYVQTAFWCLLIGGTLMYVGGTIFSEACDVEFDRKFRSQRPLPSGRVSRWAAVVVGITAGLAGGGMLWMGRGRTGLIIALVLAVFGYAIMHKRVPWVAIGLMAMCRVLLVEMVMHVPWLETTDFSDDIPTLGYYYISALGLYVGSISWMALGEIKPWRRGMVGAMLAALPLLDAAYLLVGHFRMEALVPLGCMALAIGLRKVAAAT